MKTRILRKTLKPAIRLGRPMVGGSGRKPAAVPSGEGPGRKPGSPPSFHVLLELEGPSGPETSGRAETGKCPSAGPGPRPLAGCENPGLEPIVEDPAFPRVVPIPGEGSAVAEVPDGEPGAASAEAGEKETGGATAAGFLVKGGCSRGETCSDGAAPTRETLPSPAPGARPTIPGRDSPEIGRGEERSGAGSNRRSVRVNPVLLMLLAGVL